MVRVVFPILLIFSLIGVAWTHQSTWNPKNQISFLSVGQGDATLIQTDTNLRILVDCGPPGGPILDRLQEQLGFLSRRIDMLVVTHGDSDHYGGCQEVLEHYSIDTVMINGINDPENETYTEFVANLDTTTNLIPGIAGTSISHTDLELTVLSPQPGKWGSEATDDNEYSIVLYMNTPELDVLLPGDVPIYTESQILQEFPYLDVDILKAGHHGSKTSTSSALLEATTPETVIISAGADNSFGHPHEEVVNRLQYYNINIMETKHYSSIDFSF